MCNPIQAVKKIVDAAGNVIDTTIKKIDSTLRNPLPTIETVALTYAFGPSGAGFSEATAVAISQAAVAAANGGKIENIALNVAAAYAGGQIGGAAGAALPPETTALVKQVVTSASGAAATTALRGGSMQQIISSGIAGSVNAYVSDALKEQGFTKVDNKLITNAASAATNAILNGRSVADVIGNSLAATALTAAIQGQVDQINNNNEVGNSIADKAAKLSADADAFYKQNFDPDGNNILRQTQVSTDYLNIRIAGYNSSVKGIDTAYNTYQIWLAKANANPNDPEIANQVNNCVNSYNTEIEIAQYYMTSEIPEAQTRYQRDIAAYNKVADNYANTYLKPLSDLTNQYQTLVSSNTDLSKSLTDNVAKYQSTLQTDYGDLVKQIGDQAVTDATNLIQQPVAEVPANQENLPTENPVATTNEPLPEPSVEKPTEPAVPVPPEPPKPVEPIPQEPAPVETKPQEPIPEVKPEEPAPTEPTPEEPKPVKTPTEPAPVEPTPTEPTPQEPAPEVTPEKPTPVDTTKPPADGSTGELPDAGTIEVVGERPTYPEIPELLPGPEDKEPPYVPEIPTPVTPTPVTPTPVTPTPVTPTPVTPTPVTPTPPKPVTPTPPKPVTPTPQTEPQSNLMGLLALLEKPHQQAPVQTPLADIKYFYDIMGNDIMPPTPIQNQKPTFQYAEGGTIEDLIRILRS